MTEYDVVIIGSGLGGLVSGYILSKEGLKVCVLEQHRKAGGNLQTFSRDGCIFDTGMHYLGSLDEGQYLHKYFKYLELTQKLQLKKLDNEGFDTITFDGDDTEYQMDQGYGNFLNKLGRYFPEEKKGLEQYADTIRSVVSNFPLYNISEADSYLLDPGMLSKCATALIRNTTSNEKLRNILAGAYSLYAGHAETTPLYIHACMRDSLINSSWRPIDGSQQIADHLVSGIQKYGGEVHTSYKVNQINIDNDSAKSVTLVKGDKFYAKHIISNAHPATTLKMIEEGKIRKIYRKRIMSLENTYGVFALYLVLKKDSFPYLNKNYFHYHKDGILNPADTEWPDNYYFYTPASSKSDTFAESVIVLADMKFEEVSMWQGTRINQRGTEYKEFKHRKAELLLDALEKRMPGVRQKIEKYYTSTPLSFMDFTGTHEGSAYGVRKDCNDPLRSIILPRTKVNNLYFTGQNTNLHGVLGVTASAVITCSEILGLKYLTQKIANG